LQEHARKVDGHFTGAQNQGGTGGAYLFHIHRAYITVPLKRNVALARASATLRLSGTVSMVEGICTTKMI